MKKEKREITLKQLELRKKIAWKVFDVTVILYFTGLASLFFVKLIDLKDKEDVVMGIMLGSLLSLVLVMLISLNVSKYIEICINTKKNQMKVKKLKELTKEEVNLKKSVTLIDEEIITDILSRSIEKIVIDYISGPNFVTSILLEDNTWQCQVYIPAEKLISILDENSKKDMLEYLIKDIKIGNLEGETTEVTINSLCFLYTNPKTDDEELLEMFELKEE